MKKLGQNGRKAREQQPNTQSESDGEKKNR